MSPSIEVHQAREAAKRRSPWDRSWDQTHRSAPSCRRFRRGDYQARSPLDSGETGNPALGGPPLHTREVAGLNPAAPMTTSRVASGLFFSPPVAPLGADVGLVLWRLLRTRHAKESPGGGRRVDRRRA